MSSNEEPKVTAAYVRRSDGLAWVEFEPVIVEDGGWHVQITAAYAWVANGPSAYITGRGRIVKKDGTVGARVLETSWKVVPENVRRAMRELLLKEAAK